MDKRAQTSEEVRRWVETTPEKAEEWQPEVEESAARRFFQVWNQAKGTGTKMKRSPKVVANTPLRCTVWRYRVMDFDRIWQDIKENLLPYFQRALEAVYPELATQIDPQRLAQIDYLLGKGTEPGLTETVTEKYEEQAEREQAAREEGRRVKKSPAEIAVKTFYKELAAFPQLQQQFVAMVAQDIYTDYTRAGGRGFYSGFIGKGAQKREHNLVTFYLMKDPYPFIRANPAGYSSPEEVLRDFPEGNSPDDPIEGTPITGGGKKTFNEVSRMPFAGAQDPRRWYVRNLPNPEYDFATINSVQVRNPAQAARAIKDIVWDLRQQALFTKPFFLAKNVFEEATGFEDKAAIPGLSLQDLGREAGGEIIIPEHERDLTKLENGGLFRVPEGGLPEAAEPKPTEPEESPSEQRRRKPYVVPREHMPKHPFSFTQSLIEVFGQEASMNDVWIDDQGAIYRSKEELLKSYEDQEREWLDEKFMPFLIGKIKQELAKGARPLLMPVPTPPPEAAPIGEEVPEEEVALAPAAQMVIRLVKIADRLDQRGLVEEANKVDNIVRQIIDDNGTSR